MTHIIEELTLIRVTVEVPIGTSPMTLTVLDIAFIDVTFYVSYFGCVLINTTIIQKTIPITLPLPVFFP